MKHAQFRKRQVKSFYYYEKKHVFVYYMDDA